MSVVKRIIWGSESPDYAIGGSMLVDVCLGAYCGFDRAQKRCFFFGTCSSMSLGV